MLGGSYPGPKQDLGRTVCTGRQYNLLVRPNFERYPSVDELNAKGLPAGNQYLQWNSLENIYICSVFPYEYKKRLLLRCLHHFKADLIN